MNNNIYRYMFKEIYNISHFSRIYKQNNKIIKKVYKEQYKSNLLDYLNEYNISKLFDSKYILKINETYEDTDYFYMVMDYYPKKDLYENIKTYQITYKKPEDYNLFINKLIRPIRLFHSKNIVHLDIKLENFLVDESDDFVLIDYQISKNHINKDYYHQLETKSNIIGTDAYVCPELKEKRLYSKSSDMYSLGCLLFLAFTRHMYSVNNIHLIEPLPNNIQMLISDLLNKNQNNRPTIFDMQKYLT